MNLPAPPLLELQNIQVVRGGKVVLDDFNLRIHANEHVAILGPNGCGKSTLIKTITRECYPVVREDSRISILGRERWNVFELRTLLGIVSNDLMAWCNPEAVGLEVVLSGFFSSSHIFPNHLWHPSNGNWRSVSWPSWRFLIWRIARFARCLREKRGVF